MANEVLSSVSKVRIEGTRFAVRKGDVNVTRAEHDINNSETGDFDDAQLGRRKGEVSLDFQKDPAVMEHAAPLNIARNDEIHLEVFPTGIDEDPYDFPAFLVREFHMIINPDTGEPVSGRIVGRSKGVFTMPNES